MIVAGDVYAYNQPHLDHLGGPTIVRLGCLAATLTALRLRDSFRVRHADKIAFTYIGKSGGSRINQLWSRPATGTILRVLKATLIWKWPYPTDHTPMLADISIATQQINEQTTPTKQPKWRTVLGKAKDNTTKD